jgi:hypothetical protein
LDTVFSLVDSRPGEAAMADAFHHSRIISN